MASTIRFITNVNVPFVVIGGQMMLDRDAEMTCPSIVKSHLEYYIWEVINSSMGERYKIHAICPHGKHGKIITSPITRANKRIALTENGSHYSLGHCVAIDEFIELDAAARLCNL